jgi:hypothetical protein
LVIWGEMYITLHKVDSPRETIQRDQVDLSLILATPRTQKRWDQVYTALGVETNQRRGEKKDADCLSYKKRIR